jgi:general secretion pathway protein C
LKSNLLTERNIFYLNILVGIILIISFLFLIRDGASNYFGKVKAFKKDVRISADAGKSRMKMQLADYSPIMKNNPFGFQGGEIRSLSSSSGGPVQKTDVSLIGTVVGPKELSYAVFEDSSGMQEVFKLGESVLGLGILKSVKKDKVLIIDNGKPVEIPLEEDVRVKVVDRTASGKTSRTSSFAQRIGKYTYMVDQRKVQEAISNPSQMMTDARLRPNIVNGGEGEGFVLSEVKPGGIYQSLGLRDGDVLLRINEYDISKPENALQAFSALRGLDRVQIDLIRDGSKMTMTYQIK